MAIPNLEISVEGGVITLAVEDVETGERSVVYLGSADARALAERLSTAAGVSQKQLAQHPELRRKKQEWEKRTGQRHP